MKNIKTAYSRKVPVDITDYKSLYPITGDIKDINTLLVQAIDLRRLLAEVHGITGGKQP